MRIVCPSCSAAYDVPDSLVTPGRVVRCARCGKDWTPVVTTEPQPESEPEPPPPPSVPAPSPPPEPEPVVQPEIRPLRGSAMDRLAAHPAWPRPSIRLRFAWAASVLLLVCAVVGAYLWRSEIVTVWPPSARAYALFGLHPQERSAHD